MFFVDVISIDASLKHLFVVAASEETQRPPPWWQADGSWTQSIHRHPWRSLIVFIGTLGGYQAPAAPLEGNRSPNVGFVKFVPIPLTFQWGTHFSLELSIIIGIDGPDQYHWYVCRLVLMVPRGTESSVLSAPWTTSYESDHRFGLFLLSSHGAPLDDTTLQWLPLEHPWRTQISSGTLGTHVVTAISSIDQCRRYCCIGC